MRLVIVSEKLIGNELAVPIYNADGILAVNSGMTISERIIKYLKNLGVNTIYIQDGIDEITLQDVLDTSLKLTLIKALRNEFLSIKTKNRIDENVISNIVNSIINNINLSENAFLSGNIAQKDEESILVNHSIDVAITSIIVGANSNYDAKKLFNLGVAALLHDIGKLFSKGPDHTTLGYRFVKSNNFFTPTMCVPILQHHENKDGSGFPEKISGDKIYEFSKIINICNQYISDFNKGQYLPHEIIEKLTSEATTKFDFDIYKIFNQSIHCYPNGLMVELSDGKTGTVIMQNKNLPLRPIVMICKEDGTREYINLMDNLTLFINKVLL